MNPPGALIDDLRLLEAPGPWWTQWWAVASALMTLAVAALLIWRRVRRHLCRRAIPSELGSAPQAFEDALAELERLFSFVEQEQARPYAIESSGIIRRYIERQFKIRAPLRSTEEFLREARDSSEIPADDRSLLAEFLGICDFIKFGRGLANRQELEKLHHSAVRFVSAARTGGRMSGVPLR